MARPPDDDATVVLPARQAPRPRHSRRLAVMAGLVLVIVAGLAVFLYPRSVPPAFVLRTADEATIDADRPTSLTLFRFAPDPHIVVLDFASLLEQGLMLNRVAALIEKAGLPRDRVLTDEQLDAAIRAGGDTMETYYYGHDYSAAELARFFTLATRDHVTLRPEEDRLHALAVQEGWLAPRSDGALISIPAVGADKMIDAAARRTILDHELSHGEYFTDPAYADYTRHFWHDVMTPADRAAFRRFLGSEGYDTSQDDLMNNEMQAYLMHTPDPRFFSPEAVGLPATRIAELRAAFYAGMPPGWLKDMTPKY